MKIVMDGIHANLRFSAAHMIPEHESCGFIHGHSYIIDVTVDGERSGKFGFVADFKEVKGIVKREVTEVISSGTIINVFTLLFSKGLLSHLAFSLSLFVYLLQVLFLDFAMYFWFLVK